MSARCIVCKGPGSLVVLAGKKTGVYACDKHRSKVELGGEIAGAALKAGLVTWMDSRYPGLYDRISKVVGIIRE